jgi:predicted MPP superfamily phosphohydrolase
LTELTIRECPFDIERLQREVNILVISDLHYNIRPKENTTPPDAEAINDRIVSAIADAKTEWKPDVVLIAGDLVNQCRPENYPLFFDLIRKLVDCYSNLKNTIYCTPGNHDVTRPERGDYSVIKMLQTLRDGKKRNPYGLSRRIKNIYALARNPVLSTTLMSETMGNLEKKIFATYLAKQSLLREEYPASMDHPVPGIFTSYTSRILGVNIVSHNTSFFCNRSDNDRSNLFLVLDIVKKTVESIPNTGPVISFMHHPYFFLHESEYIAPILSEEPGKEVFNCFSRVLGSSDLVISGHVHGDLQDPTFLQHHAYLITNGTSYTQDNIEGMGYPYTFALLKVNKLRRWFAMKKFIYDHNLCSYINKSGDHPPHFTFVERKPSGQPAKPYPGDPNLYSEKLDIIDHITNLDKGSELEKEYRSMVYQLGFYENGFKIDPGQPKRFRFVEEQVDSVSAVLIESVETKRRVIIYRVTEISVINPIQDILDDIKDDKQRDLSVKIYFSIDRKLFKDGNIVQSSTIGETCREYRNYVLCAKLESVGIDLLFR